MNSNKIMEIHLAYILERYPFTHPHGHNSSEHYASTEPVDAGAGFKSTGNFKYKYTILIMIIKWQ